MIKRVALIPMLIWLAACASASEATPTADLNIPTVAVSGALEPWAAAQVIAYRDQLETDVPVEFGLRAYSPSLGIQKTKAGEAAVLIAGIEPPTDWFGAPVGWEQVAVIVNAINPMRSLSRESVQDIFTGRVSDWEEMEGRQGPVQPVIPERGDELRATVGARLLEGIPFTTASRLAPTPEAMVAIVQEEPGAIGFVPMTTELEDVGLVRVAGQLPGDSGYPLVIQVIAMAPEEPSGPIRAWLGWLQTQMLEEG